MGTFWIPCHRPSRWPHLLGLWQGIQKVPISSDRGLRYSSQSSSLVCCCAIQPYVMIRSCRAWRAAPPPAPHVNLAYVRRDAIHLLLRVTNVSTLYLCFSKRMCCTNLVRNLPIPKACFALVAVMLTFCLKIVCSCLHLGKILHHREADTEHSACILQHDACRSM